MRLNLNRRIDELANQSMTRHLHEPANALLYRALDLPPEERQRFIADACEGEPELLELVRSLLSRIDMLDEFLEAPLEVLAQPGPPGLAAVAPVTQTAHAAHLAQAAQLPRVPQDDETVGDWRVLRELGRTGMDAILLVERGDGEARETGTLTIARVGGHSGATLARYQRTRIRLSNLDHAAIAHPVDAGITADGRPYFVMPYSAGVPIDQYCADARLDLNGRIALFAQVCHAVHVAHQHLLIHRDLRPANIVIEPGGAPRLLNIGVFGGDDEGGESDEANHGDASDEAGRGGRGDWQPAALFSSPEQLAGRILTTGADIYSLGAVLYALVSGRSPNAAEAAGMISSLARPAPVKPSEAVTQAFERHYPPLPELAFDDLLRPSLELARQLRGDLDDIILKAVDLDPARRYSSADSFAGDLERFLVRAPLAAAAPATERRRSLPRRHPVALAVVTLVACSLVGVTVAALWHAREADQARAAAEQGAGQATAPAGGGKPTGKHAAPAVATTATAIIKPAASAASDLKLAADRRASGDLPAAQQAATTALGVAEKQVMLNADDLRSRRELSVARGQLGAILVEQGRTADGLAELRKALVLREELAAREAGSEDNGGKDRAARDVADAHSAIAAAMMASMASADYPAAEQELALAHATYAAQLRANPADAGVRAGLIELQLARTTVQNLQHHGRDAVTSLAALHALARGAGIGKGVGDAPAGAHLRARIDLLDAHIQPRGTPAKSYAVAERALGELLSQTEKDPADAYLLRESALAWQQTGEIGLRANQGASACRYLGLAANRYEQLETSHRLNAIDKLRQGQVQDLRKACG
jgi:serine/threonine protein kinase